MHGMMVQVKVLWDTTLAQDGQARCIESFPAQDTLTSISINWGTIPGALAGTSLEIYNVAGGLPTTKFGDIVTGISLTTADEGIWKTYAPSTPIVLPAGTYWIGVHQTVALAGTYILNYDDTGLSAENYLTGFAFYSAECCNLE